MKFVEPSNLADPAAAARRLVEIASTVEAVQDGRIYIELINGPFIKEGGTPDQNRAALASAVTHGWLLLHEFRDLREIHARRSRAVRLRAADWRQRIGGSGGARCLNVSRTATEIDPHQDLLRKGD